MTKENYFKLKNEIKKLAKEIKSAKEERKLFQQAYSGISNFHKNVTMQNSADILKKWENASSKYNAMTNAVYRVEELKREFRHKHIVYSMARGKSYEQIEQKVREGNEPNWGYIKRIKEEYKFDEEKVAV